METLAIFMVSVISTFYANQVAFSQPTFPPASSFSWGHFATTTNNVNSRLNNNIDNNNINNSLEKRFEKIMIDTKTTANKNTNNDSYGVMVQTKCVNGVCNTVQKYLNAEESRENNRVIQRDVEARIAEHKKKMDDRMREVFGNF